MAKLNRSIRSASSDETMFFVVGAGKAGTTWLHDYLSSHDQVSCGPTKEYSYFCYLWRVAGQGARPFQAINLFLAQMSLARRTGNAKGYFSSLAKTLFSPMDYKQTLRGQSPDVRAFGDVSPRYATLGADAYCAMRGMHPKTKFIYIMREPVDRLWSSVQMRARDPRFKRHNSSSVFLEKHFKNKLVYESMNYPRTLDALYDAVPEADIIILFYETMFDQFEMDRLCSELGVKPLMAPLEERVFSGVKDKMPAEWAQKMYEELKHVYEFVEAKFPLRVPQYWKAQEAEYKRAV